MYSILTIFQVESKAKVLSRILLFAAPWTTVAHQDAWSMESSRQEYWSGLPLPSPGDIPDPGLESGSCPLQMASLISEPPDYTSLKAITR